MKRHMTMAVVSALGLVASADGASVHRSIESRGYTPELITYSGLGVFNAEILGTLGGRIAWLDSVVDNTRIEAVGGGADVGWLLDPDDLGSYVFETGAVGMTMSFTLPSSVYASIYSTVSSFGSGVGHAVLEGPDNFQMAGGLWDGLLEPGEYWVNIYIENDSGFTFVMDIPASGGLLTLVGGVLVFQRRRR